ncbi:hypothetical protein MUP35_02485 [Patescibacteria group bacterium]|nr:hypothetical protein [Patescibacteria group bacterium]
MVLRFVYIIFIGVLLATLVGVGIAAFYPGPKMPEPPLSIKYGNSYCEGPKDEATSQQIRQEQEKFDKDMKVFQPQNEKYNRNVSIIAIIAAILILVISLTLFKKILLIADGLLLGGVLTLIYSIIRGCGGGDNIFRFIIVSVGLVISLLLGYIKFIKPAEAKRK